MASTCHTLFFHLLLLLIFFIHGTLTCPSSIDFYCPDNIYNGNSLKYPFTNHSSPSCGHCTLTCENDYTTTMIKCGMQEQSYQVLSISTDNRSIVLNYSDQDEEWRKNVYEAHESVTIPRSPSVSVFPQGFEIIIRCDKPGHPNLGVQNLTECQDDDDQVVCGPYPYDDGYFRDSPMPGCKTIMLPNISLNPDNFTFRYNLTPPCLLCVDDGGRCSDYIPGDLNCSPPGCYSNITGMLECCPGNSAGERTFIHGVVLASSFIGALVLIFIVLFLMRRKLIDKFRSNKSVETFLENYGSLSPKRYTYAELKKLTNSFKEKLGEGGCGGVYKGKLLDGRLVAVKLLKHTDGNGEEFINEVASISRTNHVNVVTLLGFCCAGQKRALVYEFMANGSLEKFMNDGNQYGQSLPWEKLFLIVLGIARGLEYLHRGCKTRILHFDIKPHNILLNEEFCPKISDFGLAKVSHQTKQSKVTMSGTRGTIGYIAPEMFCRNFGDVSHKSDVYSYGMMVLEVIGSRKTRKNTQVGCSSDLYFPRCIYEELERGEDTEVDITTEDLHNEEKRLKRKMTIVSLWCIQTIPSSRPSMGTVLQMLEGRLESIQIPPMPSLSSPPRSQLDPSGSSTMNL